jgi:hypothetical protein
MKRKPGYKQIISGALATTFLLESCVKDYDLLYVDKSVPDINKNIQTMLKSGSTHILLNIQISEDDRKYFDFINKLTLDILQDRNKAAQFIENPNGYVESSGFSGLIISLDDDLIKLVTSIADIDIYNAIQQNNISEFIRLCKEKNLVTNFQIADIERINKLIEANPSLLSLMDLQNGDSSVVAFVIAIAVGAIVAVWAFVASHLALVNVAGGGTVIVAAAAGTWVWKTWGSDSSTSLINNDPMLLQIWALNGGNSSDTYMMLSEYEQAQMTEFITILEREFPDKLVNVDKEALKQVIALNLKQISN